MAFLENFENKNGSYHVERIEVFFVIESEGAGGTSFVRVAEFCRDLTPFFILDWVKN